MREPDLEPLSGPRAGWRSPASVVILHAVPFAILCWWSWLKWPDPLIDFGRELYVPWQLTRGKVLYRDIESLFGPLSPYVNALWMRVFGVSLLTLVACNLAILAGVVAGIHRLVLLSTDRFTASVASLTALLLFGFLQLTTVGNYNFITPYSHEATHGIALSLVVLLLLHQALTRQRTGLGVVAGLAFGMLLLTKPETSIATSAAVAVAFLTGAMSGPWRSATRRTLAAFVPSSTIAPLLFLAFFRRHLDTADALRAVGRGWVMAFDTSIAASQFYVAGMGLDHPVTNALWMALAFAAFVAFVVAAMAVSSSGPGAILSRMTRENGRPALVALAAVTLWVEIDRALPLIAMGSVGLTMARLRRSHAEPAAAAKLLLLLMWSTFALVLLAKLGLRPRVYHYGFYLALPAMTIVVVMLCSQIPHLLDAWNPGATSRRFRLLATVALAAAIAPYLGRSDVIYRTKTLPVGSGPDRFYTASADGNWQGPAVRDALRLLESARRPGDTLAVLPEGAFVNYLLRLDSPLRVITIMPPEILAFGEADILRALAAAPPRFVMLVHKDAREYGYRPFGTDPGYGLRTHEWILSRYRPLRAIAPIAEAPSGYGLRILERRD